MTVSLYFDRLINPSSETAEGVSVEISRGRISALKAGRLPSGEDIQFPDGILAPALINSHDHLKYTWPERIGEPPYDDSLEWLPSLYASAEKTFLSCLSLEELYWLGTYKSILGGVTTVANHCRRLDRDFLSQFPIRILHEFAREIFVRFDNRAHQMGLGAEAEVGLARQKNIPFVVHIAEGLNHGTECELELLERLGGVFDRSVLVHAVNLSKQDIEKISLAGASVVWCPVSNNFLFGKTAPVHDLLLKGVNVALGTDSTCTGSENLLDEMKAAVGDLVNTMSVGTAARTVFSFVTINGARAFKKSDSIGEVKVGASADLLVFKSRNDDPVVGLIDLRPKDILLLTYSGKWLLGEYQYTPKLACASPFESDVVMDEIPKKIVGRPMELLRRVAHKSGREVSFFPLGRALQKA